MKKECPELSSLAAFCNNQYSERSGIYLESLSEQTKSFIFSEQQKFRFQNEDHSLYTFFCVKHGWMINAHENFVHCWKPNFKVMTFVEENFDMVTSFEPENEVLTGILEIPLCSLQSTLLNAASFFLNIVLANRSVFFA